MVARPMIGIDQLVAHSGNVRRDLAITSEFVESFADRGLVPFWNAERGRPIPRW